MVSDGRFTTGGDPRQAARTLQARGATVSGVTIGDPAPPRDAVVGAILGAKEVFKGETIRLDVRFRITGYPDHPWDLLLTRDGEIVENRPVVGTGSWQVERFEFPADEAGVDRIVARLEPRESEQSGERLTGITWSRYAVDKSVIDLT